MHHPLILPAVVALSLGRPDVLMALFVFLERMSIPPCPYQNLAGSNFTLFSFKAGKLCVNAIFRHQFIHLC